jgi:pimeloyl-ACP methyl ester carboxylesterase
MKLELVSIKTDTYPLDGLFYTPTDRPIRAAAMFFHGNCHNFYIGPSRFMPLTLLAEGIACLTFNRRGHDMVTSLDGRNVGGGSFQLAHEAIANSGYAAAWLRGRGFANPAVIGHSNGGVLAAQYAADAPYGTSVQEMDAYGLRKRPFLTRGSGGSDDWRGPVPRQQFIEAAHGMSAGHALQHILEVGEWLDVVELRVADEGADRCPACGAAIRAREQVILAAQRDGPDGALDRVVVEFDAAVIEEAAKAVPTGQRIADRIGKAATGRDVSELRLEPSLHRRDQRKRLCLSRALSNGGRLSPDGRLDRIEVGDAPQRFGCDGRAGRLLHIIEFAPRMGPAGRELDIAAGFEPLESGIAVDLNDAFELRQMGDWALGAAIWTVKIDGCRWIRSAPGSVIAGIDPEPAGLGPAAAGIEHRDRGVVGEQFAGREDVLGELLLQRLQPPAGASDPVRQGRAIQLDTLAAEDLALSVERKVIAVFGDQDMGEQGGTGQSLGDRTLQGGGLMDGPASPATITGAANTDDPKPRRYMVEHLADGLADHMQPATAAGAGLLFKIEP